MSTTLPSRVSSDAAGANLAELAAAARAGDAEALQQLMGSLLHPIKAAVGAKLGFGHPELDDVVQEAVIRVQAALPAYRGDCSPASYARLIATREALRARRRAQKRASWLLLDPSLVDCASSTSASPSLFGWRLWQVLAELPENQAQAFVLRFALELSLSEIAEVGCVPVNTVRSRIIAARRTLQGLLSFRRFLLDA